MKKEDCIECPWFNDCLDRWDFNDSKDWEIALENCKAQKEATRQIDIREWLSRYIPDYMKLTPNALLEQVSVHYGHNDFRSMTQCKQGGILIGKTRYNEVTLTPNQGGFKWNLANAQ